MDTLLAYLVYSMVWFPILPSYFRNYMPIVFLLCKALGHGGSRAAEYLKEHLFENLMKHPKFLTDTKLAISNVSLGIYLYVYLFTFFPMLPIIVFWAFIFFIKKGETYQKTDADFLESESSAFRDDGSTASTAVLVGGHLYVANVGDSRAVISKAGKGIFC